MQTDNTINTDHLPLCAHDEKWGAERGCEVCRLKMEARTGTHINYEALAAWVAASDSEVGLARRLRITRLLEVV